MTIVYSAECMALQKPARPVSHMPLLVILFIVSYGILTLLVFEQGRTIESQRVLIRQMFQDSMQLAALKDKLARDESSRTQDKASAPAEQKSAASGNAAAGAKGSDKGAKDRTKSAGQKWHPLHETSSGKPLRTWRMCGARRTRSSGPSRVSSAGSAKAGRVLVEKNSNKDEEKTVL